MKSARLARIGLSLYGLSVLTAQAPMSIGAGLFALLLIAGTPSLRHFTEEVSSLLRDPRARRLALASLFLALALGASWVSLALDPVIHNETPLRFQARDLGKLWYLLWPFLLAIGWRRLDPSEKGAVLKVWMTGFAVITFLGVQQFFTGWPRGQANPTLVGYFHPVLLLGHHLSVASIWIFPFFIALDLFLDRKVRPLVRWSAPFWVLVLGAAFFVLFFLYSRTLWVALPIGCALWALLRLPRRVSFALLAAGAVAGLGVSQLPQIQTRLNEYLGRGDRFQLWSANWNLFQERPVFGLGFGRSIDAVTHYLKQQNPDQTHFFVGHAHNLYLEMLVTTGTVGLIALLAWILSAVLATRRAQEPYATPIAIAVAWLVFLINGATQVNFWEGKVLHMVMWTTGWVLSWRSKPPTPV